jgi:hypothetical protein
MIGRDSHDSETLDRKTSRSICDAVGERLQQSIKPHLMERSPELERLVEELRRRETEHGLDLPSRGSRRRFFF